MRIAIYTRPFSPLPHKRKGLGLRLPLAMPIYALAMVPLIRELSTITKPRQVRYANDSAAAGKFLGIHHWWDTLTSQGPSFCYFTNAKKTWLMV